MKNDMNRRMKRMAKTGLAVIAMAVVGTAAAVGVALAMARSGVVGAPW